jgi:hypothetical protein
LAENGRFDAASSPSKSSIGSPTRRSHATDVGIDDDKPSELMNFVDKRILEYKRKAEEMLKDSKDERSLSNSFMEKLRAESQAKRDLVFSGVK